MNRVSLIMTLLIINILAIHSLEVPTLKGRVNDYGNMLTTDEESRLEQIIMSKEVGTTSQIAILTIPSLEGDNIEDFSIRTVDEWQLGEKGSDNGALILIALNERKIRIEVGYGLEGTLTDAKADYIIRNVLSTQLKKGNTYLGLRDAFLSMSGVISGEYTINDSDIRESNKQGQVKTGIPVSFIFMVLFVIFSSLGRSGYRGRRGRGSGLGTFLILNSLLGGGSRRSSGGFGGGGFSGGGFSGGGGGFGGGGASGGW